MNTQRSQPSIELPTILRWAVTRYAKVHHRRLDGPSALDNHLLRCECVARQVDNDGMSVVVAVRGAFNARVSDYILNRILPYYVVGPHRDDQRQPDASTRS